MINSILSIQKPQKDPNTLEVVGARIPLLEKQIIALVLEAVDNTETDPEIEFVWQNLTSLLVYFLLYQFINYNSVVEGRTTFTIYSTLPIPTANFKKLGFQCFVVAVTHKNLVLILFSTWGHPKDS